MTFTIFCYIWAALLALITLIWLSRHREISRAKREHLPLYSNSYPGPPKNPPRLSVLIAGKDEEANIEQAVRTALEQDYPNFELIVVNDRSTDRTGEILERLKAEIGNGRMQVVHIDRLPEGWFGKNHAMHRGVELATGEWLCFGDADCRQTSTKTFSMAMRHAIEWNIDFLSILPGLETQSFWERVIQPVCGALMVFWFHPRKVNDPRDPAAYANGAFMLMRRSCYDTIGGHEAVRTQVNEDMHMARLAKERGQRLVVVQSGDLYVVRMYSRLKDIWRGWSRIFYGCFGTFRRLRITLLVLVLMTIFPFLSLLVSATAVAIRGLDAPGWPIVLAASIVYFIVQQSVITRFYRLSKANPWLAPTWFLGACFSVGMLINAMLKLKGRTGLHWRGSVYRGEQVANA